MRPESFYITNRECPQCKQLFMPVKQSGLGTFCSTLCKSRAWEKKKHPRVEKSCTVCGKEYVVRSTNKLKKYCSRKCYVESEFKVEHDANYTARKNIAFHQSETEFSKEKEKYADKLIPYPESPTGKAYIGFAKEPLMKHDQGFGYQGVLLQSENRAVLQCAACGVWVKKITSTHLKKHALTIPEYKLKYGLNKNTGLISDVESNFAAAQMVDNVNKAGKRVPEEKLYELREKAKKIKKYPAQTREQQNVKGTCPEQLKDALIQFIHRFHRIPSSTSGRAGFSKLSTYKHRFGSINKALAHYGLPTRYHMGHLSDPQIHFTRRSVADFD